MTFDVAVVGAGPAGSSCAALCAAAGRTTLLLERAQFPREKVCGDCLNPASWEILDRLGATAKLLAQPHIVLRSVHFIGINDERLAFRFPHRARETIAIKRSILDNELLQCARRAGAQIVENAPVTELQRENELNSDRAKVAAQRWCIRTASAVFRARLLIAADGRNSTIARMLHLLPATKSERIGLQRHVRRRAEFREGVALHFFPGGYCGVAPVADEEMNICLVAKAAQIEAGKAWATRRFGMNDDAPWRTIAPLSRRALAPADDGVLLTGDAARVVEPFTGEGIFYALASGALAARCIIDGQIASYPARHASLYRGRLWINQIARIASLHPHLGTRLVRFGRSAPRLVQTLVDRVIGRENADALTSAEAV